MKKVLILYDTVFGNTRRVAMALSRGLEAGNFYVDCSSILSVELGEIVDYDVIGIGGPTHFHGSSKEMKSFLGRLKDLKMENKRGFVFETRGDFRFAGSAANKIMKILRKMRMKIMYPVITGIVLEKEGPLQSKTLERIEQIGLELSDKLNGTAMLTNKNQEGMEIKHRSIKGILNYLKWILIGGGPIFFFSRALNLASTGGGCLGTIIPGFSWFLLVLELTISGLSGVFAILALTLLKLKRDRGVTLGRFNLKRLILFTGVSSYSIHFIRVGIWITLCVL
ncbi:MAG: FprA family A-type flavoprotein [Candidatus Lokiarchaeota archaeon]|nr:FprA family A-type flavoprotein [Candidatus Lokiarchaeota archaeon]